MTLASFAAYAIALAIAAAIPGPGVVAIVSRALGTGFRRTVPLVLGLTLGDIVFLTLAVAGLAVLARTFSDIFLLIRIAGAAYLLWFAFRLWRDGVSLGRISASPGRRDGIQSFLAGLFLTLGNPKTIVFYMALLPAVIDLGGVTVADWLVLVFLTIAVLLLVLLPYAFLAARVREAFSGPSALLLAGRFASAVLAGTAVWIVARG